MNWTNELLGLVVAFLGGVFGASIVVGWWVSQHANHEILKARQTEAAAKLMAALWKDEAATWRRLSCPARRRGAPTCDADSGSTGSGQSSGDPADWWKDGR